VRALCADPLQRGVLALEYSGANRSENGRDDVGLSDNLHQTLLAAVRSILLRRQVLYPLSYEGASYESSEALPQRPASRVSPRRVATVR
jgi:hypothetical protein